MILFVFGRLSDHPNFTSTGATVAGRADVILDRESGFDTALAVLDCTLSASALGEHELQLQFYADAGGREGAGCAWCVRP